MALAIDTIAGTCERDGFVFPLDVLSEPDAKAVRADLEAAESELADDPERLALLRTYPDRLLPSFDELIRHPALIEAVKPILG
ncbi:MAG: phytanoyl-CoA dioxygenase family protein, partial [Alphaproteobacteria bacterium]|nr:phytanoyl-CoA dioxygenase family protein [Alphaproteobacteria bacterium]